ncbi:MAG: hypothetical protein ACK4V6_06820 [Microthrixaceae bacterium]
MGVAARLAAFAVVLVVCFAGAFALGSAVGPFDTASSSEYHESPGPQGDGDAHDASTEHGG